MLYQLDNRGRRSVYSLFHSAKVSQWILFRPSIGPLVQQWGLTIQSMTHQILLTTILVSVQFYGNDC